MVPSPLGPIVRRPRRALALLLSAVVVFAASGCGHKRQSMRPVYLTPAPSAVGGPRYRSLPSSTTIAPVDPDAAPTSNVEPTLIEPVPEAAPAAPLTITPTPGTVRSVPRLDSPPPVSAPVVPGGGSVNDEPPLLEPASPTESSKVAPKIPGATKGSAGPRASFNGPRTTKDQRTAPAPGRVRQASLRDTVRPYVNEPADLFTPPKADRPWKYIVLHHSATETGGYGAIDREHRKRLGWDGCGYHFVIGNGTDTPDGQIEVAQRWVNQKHGVHCRDGKSPDVNEYGIGICLVGDLEKSPPTAKQIAAARALVAYLGSRYTIPTDHAETHAHLASSPTACPGRLFPTETILGSRGLTLR